MYSLIIAVYKFSKQYQALIIEGLNIKTWDTMQNNFLEFIALLIIVSTLGFSIYQMIMQTIIFISN